MLLTLDEYRGLNPDSELEDEPTQLLLDAAEAEIVRAAGPVGSVTETFTSEARLLALGRQASSITSVEERSVASGAVYTPAIAADDYYLWPSGAVLERVPGGTTSRHHWRGRTTVVYVPEDDVDIRKIVQADLAGLMEKFKPGTTSETVGAWSRQLAANSVWNNSKERESILSRLFVGGRMAVIS